MLLQRLRALPLMPIYTWPGTLRCVLQVDTWVSQCLSPPRWVPANLTLRVLEPCDGQASHPGGSRNTPNRFMPQTPEIIAGLVGRHCEGICVLCKTPEPVDSDLSSDPNCSARMGIQCTNHYAFVRIFFHDNCFYFQYRFTFRLWWKFKDWTPISFRQRAPLRRTEERV